ncbi:MAG TPA: hypothetical protein VHD62_18920 [Opitutaceae bacterium]|nr:hypothetical protein [Opitutaceae bacterium]
MTPRRRIFLFLTIACLLAIALGAPRYALRYRSRLAAQPAAVARWERQIQQTRQQRDSLWRRLEVARQQPARSPAAVTDSTSPAPDLLQLTETERWVRQVKQLKQLFAQQPEQRIPELAVLDDQDWLGLGRRVQLDTEDHRARAFALVRNEAKNTFVQLMREALEAYMKANRGQLPTDPTELQPYLFAPTLDPAMLARYEMVRTGALSDAPKGPVLKEKDIVNETYDARMAISREPDATLTYGFDRKRDPADANDAGSLNDQIEHDIDIAVRGFVAAHPGALPKNPAALLPYFNPPLGPAMTESINRPLSAEQQQEFEADIVKRAAAIAPK